MTSPSSTDARPPVDPGFGPLLDLLASPGIVPLSSMSPTDARDVFRDMRSAEGELVSVASVDDRDVPGPDATMVPVRVVVPLGPVRGVLAWFHGGGFVIGDLDTAEATQRRLATAAGCAVVSVDYRLAPEFPAPAAAEDCWAVTRWVAEHAEELAGPGARVAVGGDSAGGNLAAVVAQRAAAAGLHLALQLLVYPATDATTARPSIEENGEGYFLTADTMRWFFEQYHSGGLPPEDLAVSPILADLEALARTAPAVVQVAGYDPLHDEGVDYAERLREAGVKVDLVDYPTMIHGFWAMATLTPVSDEAVAQAGVALRAALAD